MTRFWILPLLILVWSGCGEKPVTKIYEAARLKPIACMRLDIYPASPEMERMMRKLYPFNKRCDTVLEVRHKENICCNSNQNAARKALSAFPHHFLRLEVRRGLTPLYSYYIDLQHRADEEDLREAFARLKKDLGF
ncbi:hypothetical protein [Hydrogenimonas cancrithermarum]|uniref:Lipoprotein n=1 Tax=Hydrogenimonas cancrithermarum TaxID=2993563 RepID=A0ABM8FLH4_9BACT|nr:hypothetical protein [Hydrogenimonas cancrithermarum]BDY13201.1 hypothetical protein HCR_15130 [Hydrogenimonas cancrithermarum]